ncbi:WhiB family transcriptional regulator [Mycolicibacterium sphagni]|nr:WhiB family transcriptional regulator [Mycolicibacterium sphagni]
MDLFDAVGLAPALPGARCRGRATLFDLAEVGTDPEDAEYAEQAAKRLCAQCPSLMRCRAWYEALPRSRRPFGVVAGLVNRPKSVGRPRRTA